jgi:hypothetical protein
MIGKMPLATRGAMVLFRSKRGVYRCGGLVFSPRVPRCTLVYLLLSSDYTRHSFSTIRDQHYHLSEEMDQKRSKRHHHG